ncbi:MAG TPA: DUF5666 domain-containing protein [Acidimicrobiales bacterium]
MTDYVTHEQPTSEPIDGRQRRESSGSQAPVALVLRLCATLALALAGVVFVAGAANGSAAASAHRHQTRHALRHRASVGSVTAVNGASGAGSCGTASATGTFSLTSRHGTTRTIDVTSSTAFAGPSSASVSFANVCVGTDVAVSGHPTTDPHTITASKVALLPIPAVTTAAPAPPAPPPAAAGKVTSVNGSTTAGSCGTAGATGTFALDTFKGTTVDVSVTSSTSFAGTPPATPASFANVCVGTAAAVLGTAGSTPTAFTATKVFEFTPHSTSPRPPVVAGKVTSVNGSSTSGSCGTPGGTGTITLTTFKGATVTADVTSSTTFSEGPGSSPSFADVCVGSDAAALGTPASTPTSFTATKVFVVAPRPSDPGSHGWKADPGVAHGASHSPSSGPAPIRTSSTLPGGSDSHWSSPFTAPGKAVVSGTVTTTTANSIVVNHGGKSQTIDVNASTTYTAPTGPSSLALVAAGDLVKATGTVANGVFTASTVTVLPPAGPAPGAALPSGSSGNGGHGGPPAPAPAPAPASSPYGQHPGQGGQPGGSPSGHGAPGFGTGHSPTSGGATPGGAPSGVGGSSTGGSGRR